jgi:hypothetical protein
MLLFDNIEVKPENFGHKKAPQPDRCSAFNIGNLY